MANRYPLARLLLARRFRENEAAREAVRAEQALEDARERLRLALEELKRYREWRPKEEERLFAKIRGQWLSTAGLDDYREEVGALRLGELDREEACRAAEREAEKAKEEAEAAHKRHAEAAKNVMKLEEHRRRWQSAEDKAREAREEVELEEFSRHFLPGDETDGVDAVLLALDGGADNGDDSNSQQGG